jgi:uncharacterized protein (DUF849 family)
MPDQCVVAVALNGAGQLSNIPITPGNNQRKVGAQAGAAIVLACFTANQAFSVEDMTSTHA